MDRARSRMKSLKSQDRDLNQGSSHTEVNCNTTAPSARDLFLPKTASIQVTPDFIFQQYGAPCYTAKVCKYWFQQNGIQLLDWPGNSPDLNPIENLWACLKCLVSKRRPSNQQQLIEAIIESWHHVILPDNLQSLVASMPKRRDVVIKARGYPTRY